MEPDEFEAPTNFEIDGKPFTFPESIPEQVAQRNRECERQRLRWQLGHSNMLGCCSWCREPYEDREAYSSFDPNPSGNNWRYFVTRPVFTPTCDCDNPAIIYRVDFLKTKF